MTRYVILKDEIPRPEEPGWHKKATVEATSAEAAVRQVAEPGVYVAVPERSWKPMNVRPSVRVSPAGPERPSSYPAAAVAVDDPFA